MEYTKLQPGADLVEFSTHVFLYGLHSFAQLLRHSLTLQALHVERVDASRKDEKRHHSDVRSRLLQDQQYRTYSVTLIESGVAASHLQHVVESRE